MPFLGRENSLGRVLEGRSSYILNGRVYYPSLDNVVIGLLKSLNVLCYHDIHRHKKSHYSTLLEGA